MNQHWQANVLTRGNCVRSTDLADARDYILAPPEDREFKHHWQHTAKMILDQADVADVSRRVELTLFYDGKLDLVALYG